MDGVEHKNSGTCLCCAVFILDKEIGGPLAITHKFGGGFFYFIGGAEEYF